MDKRGILIHRPVIFQSVMGVDPVGDPRQAGGVGNGADHGTVQKLLRIKYIINLLIFQETVRMDPGAGHIEVLPDKGRTLRNVVADLLFIILRKLRDDGGIHTVQIPLQLGVLEYHGLQGRVAGPFSDAEQRGVHAGAAVQPGRGGIGDGLVKIIVAVPLQQGVGNARMGVQGVDDAGNASGDNGPGIVHAVAHGIAGADLDRDLIFLHQLHQLHAEGNHIAVDIGPGDVLQMASGADPLLQAVADNAQVMLHRLPSCHLQLHENMIIGAADQNAGLLHADLLHQAEILLARPDPAGHLRKPIAPFHALIDRVPVLLAVKEKFAGAHHSVGAAQPVQIIIDGDDLIRGIGGAGLLSVPEGGIRDPDLLRHVVRHDPVVEGDLRDLRIGEHIPEHVRLLHVVQDIHMLLDLKKIVLLIHGHRAIGKGFIGIHVSSLLPQLQVCNA